MNAMMYQINSLPQFATWFAQNWWLFAVVTLWSIAWKGLALWRAAERRQKGWFVALLIINTVGILEIIYLYVVARKPRATSASPLAPQS